MSHILSSKYRKKNVSTSDLVIISIWRNSLFSMSLSTSPSDKMLTNLHRPQSKNFYKCNIKFKNSSKTPASTPSKDYTIIRKCSSKKWFFSPSFSRKFANSYPWSIFTSTNPAKHSSFSSFYHLENSCPQKVSILPKRGWERKWAPPIVCPPLRQ